MMNDWMKIWIEDKQSIIDTMIRNMKSDLEAGYDPYGKSITQQRKDIQTYTRKFSDDMEKLSEMDPNKVQHWCYIQLLKAGAITI